MHIESIEAGIKELLETCETVDEKMEVINQLQSVVASNNPIAEANPVANVQWRKVASVSPNDYNPNSVPGQEMQLLHLSIMTDGYTQPIVGTIEDDKDVFEIVDGFHRYFTCFSNEDTQEMTQGYLPTVKITPKRGGRIEATVRHNRARGRHSINGMVNIVFNLLDEGYSDEEVMQRLGMKADELVRLKHITGFSKLLENHEYSKALTSKRMLLKAKELGEQPL